MLERNIIYKCNQCHAPRLLGECSTSMHVTNGTNIESTTLKFACVQIQKGVAFSTYEVRVDRMTVLRGNTTEQAALLASAANATRVVSMVAFR
jgi:hypothetical protein